MTKDRLEKTQEEIFKERADVLSRAGKSLADALERLEEIGKSINAKLDIIRFATKNKINDASFYRDLNKEIQAFNKAREYAELRRYYLIVTREALGLRRHTWIEKTYKIPPRRREISRHDESIQKSKD